MLDVQAFYLLTVSSKIGPCALAELFGAYRTAFQICLRVDEYSLETDLVPSNLGGRLSFMKGIRRGAWGWCAERQVRATRSLI
jgi:hypothetical protein